MFYYVAREKCEAIIRGVGDNFINQQNTRDKWQGAREERIESGAAKLR